MESILTKGGSLIFPEALNRLPNFEVKSEMRQCTNKDIMTKPNTKFTQMLDQNLLITEELECVIN